MLLKLTNISKTFDTQTAHESLTVLDDLSFEAEQGDRIAIVGPSGSGKTTLLNIMGTLDRPTSGQVLLDGLDLNSLDPEKLAQIRNQDIGFVFQLHHLLPQCTVLENILIPTLASPGKTTRKDVLQHAQWLLEQTNMEERAHFFPAQLSGGERQRVAVARALIHKPKLVLADEPTGSLDSQSAGKLADMLKALAPSVGLIIVTHSMDIALRMEKAYSLENGKLIQKLLNKQANEAIKEP